MRRAHQGKGGSGLTVTPTRKACRPRSWQSARHLESSPPLFLYHLPHWGIALSPPHLLPPNPLPHLSRHPALPSSHRQGEAESNSRAPEPQAQPRSTASAGLSSTPAGRPSGTLLSHRLSSPAPRREPSALRAPHVPHRPGCGASSAS